MPIIVTPVAANSTVFHDITAALNNHLNNMSGLPAVAWENIDYQPTLDALFIRPTNLQGETIVDTDLTEKTTGVYQIDIYAPTGKGHNEIVTMTDTLANRFKEGTETTYNGLTVVILKASRTPMGRDNEGWTRVMFEAEYHAFSTKR